uniref:Uncharacterized protein n=1 Tax=Clastoptera arizonana TaxID=38151 RepID=A0A1B6DXY8_9HEMI
MDLVYLSDVMAYQAVRGPIYDRYDQKWDQNIEKSSQQKHYQSGSRREKPPCKICQERQRRTLMSYIRSKSHDSCGEEQIIEEEEETEKSPREVKIPNEKEEKQN